jgi:ATP-binding cassette subfamily A (ABC1) protein 3
MHAHRVSAFSGSQLQYVVLLFVCYGVSVIPLMYLASFLFENPSTAYTRLTMFNIITGMFLFRSLALC